jgi:hypothetical protein
MAGPTPDQTLGTGNANPADRCPFALRMRCAFGIGRARRTAPTALAWEPAISAMSPWEVPQVGRPPRPLDSGRDDHTRQVRAGETSADSVNVPWGYVPAWPDPIWLFGDIFKCRP